MEFIFGLIGVVLGFLLNEVSQWLRGKSTEEKQKKVVRTLLRLEIDQNLDLLQDIWDQVSEVEDEKAKPFQLVDLPLPPWSHKALESQLSLVTTYLSEVEIKQVYDLNGQLDAITILRDKLSNLRSEHLAIGPISSNDDPIDKTYKRHKMTSIGDSIEKHFKQCQEIVDKVLEKGNPLQN